MRIIQFGSTGVVLILKKQIKYLLCDIVGIGGDFFFFCREVHNPIPFAISSSNVISDLQM